MWPVRLLLFSNIYINLKTKDRHALVKNAHHVPQSYISRDQNKILAPKHPLNLETNDSSSKIKD